MSLEVRGGHGEVAVSLCEVSAALSTQGRVIRALILRETMTRYGQHKLGFLWAFLEPILMVTILSLIFQLMGRSSQGGMDVVPFMITGFGLFVIFRDTMGQTQSAISQNTSLIGFPQVTTFDVMISRALLELAVLLCVLTVMLWGTGLIGLEVRCERPLELLGVCLLLCMCGLGLGFVFASLTPLVPSMRQITGQLLGRPLFLSSGLFFTTDSLPDQAREVLLYNPLLHMIEKGRSAYFYEYESQYASWSYAICWALGLITFGLTFHQALRKRAIVAL
ncbi:MAG: ABC transporter permease [Granulosicoccus sp.]